jgi:hypothetical protein
MRLVDADNTFTGTVENVYLVNTSLLLCDLALLFSAVQLSFNINLHHHHPLIFPLWQIVFKTKSLPFSCKHSYCICVHSFPSWSPDLILDFLNAHLFATVVASPQRLASKYTVMERRYIEAGHKIVPLMAVLTDS